MRECRPCGEAQQNCDAPANVIGAYTLGTCYYCGQPVCGRCSQRVAYPPYGRVRIGDDCLIEIFGKDGAMRVMTKLYREAGYANPVACAAAHLASEPDGVTYHAR